MLTLNTSQLNIIKRWKTCTMTHDYKVKQIYPSINPNPKGIQGIGNQINASRPMYELEGEST
jgi:hypothetical protein